MFENLSVVDSRNSPSINSLTVGTEDKARRVPNVLLPKPLKSIVHRYSTQQIESIVMLVELPILISIEDYEKSSGA